MTRRTLRAGPRRLIALVGGASLAALALPAVAAAQDGPTLTDVASGVDTTWVMVAAILVMFMQAGFLLLEIGFSRMKNAGAGVAKVLMNFSIASLAYWAVGFAIAFGGTGTIAGNHGFFLNVGHSAAEAADKIPLLGTYNIAPAALFFFQFVFCAVSLAIVWGTTLERIKWQAYALYAVIFGAVI
jgi:ammonium transporter, Amt family